MIEDDAMFLRRLAQPAFSVTNRRASALLTGITSGVGADPSDPPMPHWTKLYAVARTKVDPSFRLRYRRAERVAGGWQVHFTFHRKSSNHRKSGKHEGIVFVAREELA